MIALRNVSASIDGRTVLRDINLALEPGESVCIGGPESDGKRALILLLLADLVPTEGVITVDNANLSALPPSYLRVYRKNVGVLMRDALILADRTVAENIACILKAHGNNNRKNIAAKTRELLSLMNLRNKASENMMSLSRIEQQKVALARAIALEPKILIASDPAGDLNPDEAASIFSLLLNLHDAGTTVILTCTNCTRAREYGFRMLRMEHGTLFDDTMSRKSRTQESVPATILSA